MSSLVDIDKPLKVIFSRIYRMILLVFSIILLIKEVNDITYFVYVLPFVYYSVYELIIKKLSALIRLSYDYLFIIVILTIVSSNSLLGMMFFLVPFINAPNHQDDKKNVMILFYISFISFTIIESIKAKEFIFDVYSLIALLITTLIIYFEYIRSIFFYKILDSYREMDSINFEKSRASNIPFTYKKLIELLNSKLFPSFFIHYKIEYISSFVIRNNQLSILNSSKFFAKISTTSDNIDKINTARKKDIILQNIPIELSEHGINKNNIIIPFQYKKSSIYFILFFNDKFEGVNTYLLIIINNYLKPLFKKVIKTIKFEEHIKNTQLDNIKNLLSDMKYVSTTNKSLHTINNEFTPIKNYFKMIKEAELFNEERKKEVYKKIDKQAPQAIKSFEKIIELSETILDKNLNPFSLKNVRKYSIKIIFMKLKLLCIHRFDEDNIKLDIKEEELRNTEICTDINILEMLFLDIIENIHRNQIDENNYSIKIEILNEKVEIAFNNEVYLDEESNKRRELINSIKLFNNDERIQLLLKKGHGFANIKEMVTNLGILCELKLEENIFSTKLIFDIKEK